MIPGISSSGGYFPPSFVTKVRTSTAQTSPQSPAPEIQPEPQPAEFRAPEGTKESLTQEYNLLDLANRQYAEILPRIELATTPVN